MGCISFNFLTFYVKDSDGLLYCTAILLTVVVLPVFFFLEESPRFLHQKGEVQRMVQTLKRIGEKNKSSVSKHKLGLDA